MNRVLKRFIIILFYIAAFGGVFFLIWNAMRTPASCVDGRQNQNEEAVDCGGVCGACTEVVEGEPFVIDAVTLLPASEDRYNVLVELKNPNAFYGARSVPYVIRLLDVQGLEIERVQGTTFILPGQVRYIVESNILSDVVPARAEVDVDLSRTEWVRFNGFEDPDFIVDGERFGLLADGSVYYAEAFGSVHNRSPFDFQRVYVAVVIRDERGTALAVNQTIMDDFVNFTQRDFRLPWRYTFPGDFNQLDVQVAVDVFDADNFIGQFAPEVRSLDQR